MGLINAFIVVPLLLRNKSNIVRKPVFSHSKRRHTCKEHAFGGVVSSAKYLVCAREKCD